jgi:hypothetical protein
MPLQFVKAKNFPFFGNLISFLFWKPSYMRVGANFFLSNWGFTSSSKVHREGLSGGLVLGWTQDWEVSIIFQNRHFIHTEITNLQGEVFTVTFLYGHPNLAQRHLIWNELQTFGSQIHNKWVCVGDFN